MSMVFCITVFLSFGVAFAEWNNFGYPTSDGIKVGGGYGDTGSTFDNYGNIQGNGTLTGNTAVITTSATFGGGYGSTGASVSTTGKIETNNEIVTDGRITASEAYIGGGYGSTGATVYPTGNISSDGDLLLSGQAQALNGFVTTSGNITTTNGYISAGGAIGAGTGLSGASLNVGGGYGATGASISSAGVGQYNGSLTTDNTITANTGVIYTDVSVDGNLYFQGDTTIDVLGPWDVLSMTAGGVDVDNDGYIYVSVGGNQIVKYNSQLAIVTSWSTSNAGAICINSSGNLVVTRKTQITVYSNTGTALLTFGSAGTGDGEFNTNGMGLIALDLADNIYVNDFHNSRIQKFNSAGEYQSKWDYTEGDGNDQLDGSSGIDIDGSGNIYIADRNNNRIQKRNSSFVYVASYNISEPNDVKIDSGGNIWTSGAEGVITKHNSSGTVIETWGSPGSGVLQFGDIPTFNIDNSGGIYVVDTENARFVVLSEDTDMVTLTLESSNGSITVAVDGDITADNLAITNWNTAYTDRLKWDGGATGLVAATGRASLDLEPGTDVQAYDAQLADIAGLAVTDGNVIVGDGTNWVAESGATARASLGLGSIATQAADNVNLDGGAIDGTTIGATTPSSGVFSTLAAKSNTNVVGANPAISFKALDSTNAETDYAKVGGEIVNNTNGTENGKLRLKCMFDGVDTTFATIGEYEAQFVGLVFSTASIQATPGTEQCAVLNYENDSGFPEVGLVDTEEGEGETTTACSIYYDSATGTLTIAFNSTPIIRLGSDGTWTDLVP